MNLKRRLRERLLVAAVGMGLFGCGGNASLPLGTDAETLFQHGMAQYQEGDWLRAIQTFERFLLEYPSHPRSQEVRYRLADAHFGKEDYVFAAGEFARFATEFPSGQWADDARFKVCEAYYRLSPGVPLDQQYTRAALDHCQSLIAYYPDSEFVPRAQEILMESREKLANKLLEGAEFYFRRQAYDSAIKYFQEVVEQYPGSTAAPRALLRLIEANNRIGYEDEAAAARERLLRDYPETSEAAQLRQISVAAQP